MVLAGAIKVGCGLQEQSGKSGGKRPKMVQAKGFLGQGFSEEWVDNSGQNRCGNGWNNLLRNYEFFAWNG